MLGSLKKFGADETNLLNFYFQQVKSITVWNAGLSQQKVREMERLQKVALAIMREDQYTSYKEALAYFQLDTLESRRTHLCLQCAIKAFRNTKFTSSFFLLTPFMFQFSAPLSVWVSQCIASVREDMVPYVP